MKKFFKVFTAGKYPQGTVTEQDIKEIAESYSREYHEAPLTINHDDKSPAYAVVDSVIAKGKDLLVSFADMIDEAFDVNKKFKKPSVEIAEYDNKKYLRAVSLTNFPQVKGLDKIQFAEGSTIFFNENLTINLSKGKEMFSEQVIALAEKLSINVNDYSVEGDLLLKAAEIIDGLKADLISSKEKLSSRNLSLSKYAEANITVESFNQLKQEKDSAIAELNKYGEERIDSLINFAVSTKNILPAQAESLRAFAKSSFDEAKKFVEGLPAKTANNPAPRLNDNGKDYTYEEVVKDPDLVKLFSEQELAEMRKQSKIFS